MYSRRMCLRYCVLGFPAHSNISGDDSDCEDDGYDYDRYDFMGYGTDFEEVLMSSPISAATHFLYVSLESFM